MVRLIHVMGAEDKYMDASGPILPRVSMGPILFPLNAGGVFLSAGIQPGRKYGYMHN